jgi:hypothetical protein
LSGAVSNLFWLIKGDYLARRRVQANSCHEIEQKTLFMRRSHGPQRARDLAGHAIMMGPQDKRGEIK